MRPKDYQRVTCPTCGRRIAGDVHDGDDPASVRLVRHLAPRAPITGAQTWCPASEQLAVRDIAGEWRLEPCP